MNNIKAKGGLTPIESFISREIELCDNLFAMIKTSLDSLKNVLYNGSVLTNTLYGLSMTLLKEQVPWNWSKHWCKGEGPGNIKKFLKELCLRYNYLHSWIHLVQDEKIPQINNQNNNIPISVFSKPISLQECINPAMFFNSL
eukprot:UN34795